ncbi:MAG: hypothetical protein ACON3Z_06640 [Bradymonadia bacterium]
MAPFTESERSQLSHRERLLADDLSINENGETIFMPDSKASLGELPTGYIINDRVDFERLANQYPIVYKVLSARLLYLSAYLAVVHYSTTVRDSELGLPFSTHALYALAYVGLIGVSLFLNKRNRKQAERICRKFKTGYAEPAFYRYKRYSLTARLLASYMLGLGLYGLVRLGLSDVRVSDPGMTSLIPATLLMTGVALFIKARSIAARRAYGKSLETTDKG